jgi:hypothetical protein
LEAAGARIDLRVDADHRAAAVEERAARVARVDRRIGLDERNDRIAWKRASLRADDPDVAVCSRPYGAPIASTGSPTSRFFGSPSRTTGRPLASIFSTAMSVAVSKPSTLAVYSRRSLSLTVTSLASRTTCALVRIRPSGLMMKPEPRPLNGIDGFWRPRWPKPGTPRKKRKKGSSSRPGGSPCSSSDALCEPSTVMPTTAGADCLTMAR